MKFKTKLGAIAVSAAMASMVALPAFAVESPGQDVGGTPGQTEATGDFIINANVTNSTDMIKVTLPTKVAVAYQLDSANSQFKKFFAPDTAHVINHTESSHPVDISVSLDSAPAGFLAAAQLNLVGDSTVTLADSLANAELFSKVLNDNMAKPISFTTGVTTDSVDLKPFEGKDQTISTTLKVTLNKTVTP